MDNLKFSFDFETGQEVIGEQIRELRTSILLQHNKCTSLLFTSIYPKEGKSTISLLLADSLSRCEKRVLWIDCNVHSDKKPYSIFETKKKKEQHKRERKRIEKGRVDNKEKNLKTWGFLDYLKESCELKEILHTVNEKFDWIPCFYNENMESELFEHEVFLTSLRKFEEDYDYVILDSSSLSQSMDSSILASKCDGTILVIEYNKVSKNRVRKAIEEIKKCQGNLIGAVLNRNRVSRYK